MYQLKKEKRIINYYISNLQKIVWIVTFLHNLLGNFIEAAFQFLRSFHKPNKINWCFNAKIIITDVTRKVVIHVIIEIQFSPHSQKTAAAYCTLLLQKSKDRGKKCDWGSTTRCRLLLQWQINLILSSWQFHKAMHRM